MLWRMAWRYVVGKKSTQAIQLIAWVSLLAMAMGTACLLLVLSVFNGFDGFIKGLYSDYYPELKITAKQGNYLSLDSISLQRIQQVSGIASVAHTLEEKVLLVYDQNQSIALLKGVSSNYTSINAFAKHIKYGEYLMDTTAELPSMVLGIGLSNRLTVNDQSPFPVNAYVLGDAVTTVGIPTEAYRSQLFSVKGVFVLQEDIDNQLAIVPLQNLQSFLDKPDAITAIEIKLTQPDQEGQVKQQLTTLLASDSITIQNRYEQNQTLYFILRSERLAVFAILSFMLLIASFNIIGSLSMLIIDKEKDIAILHTLGLSSNRVQLLFIRIGILLSLGGGLLGMLLAFVVGYLQQQFGFVKLGNADNFLIDAYPVEMHLEDFLMVLALVVVVALVASWLPAKRASRRGIWKA